MDLTEFTELQKPKPGACQIGAALEALPEEKAAKLRAAIGSSEIRDSSIAKWLALAEQRATMQAVSHHRRGTCRCHD